MSAQFNILAADSAAANKLQQELGLPHFVAATLVARGIVDVQEAQRFLSPSLDRDWLDPYIIPGLSDVADLVEEAIKADAHIAVFGDFDLDGISATATLTRGLRVLGANASPFIPLRFEEGYGLSLAAFERLQKECNPDLVVTVDCGIACKVEAQAIVKAGVKLVITDHHEPVDLVPEDVPVADPKLVDDCESSILAGVGVALKLLQVLGGRLGRPHLWREYTDLATLGTVADLMPMRGENRALVSDGLACVNNRPRPCIAALLAQAGVGDKLVTATNLSFTVIPRLNAAGRMGNAQIALDLLLSESFEEASRHAAELESVNDQRRTIEAELSEIAKAQAKEIYHGQRALVVSGEGWHEGVKGIVASRLVGSYGVPSLLFTIDGDEARGSGRSVGQVSLLKAIESTSDILTRFGGHEAAVGVTLPADKLPEFTERICAYLDELPAESFHPLIEIDACVSLAELTLENVAMLQSLAPFGQENTVPRYLARNITLSSCRAVGSEKTHFSCVLSDGKSSISAIMFHCSDIEGLMQCDCVVNAAFEVQIDEWRGKQSVKAMLSTLSPARSCIGLEACLNPESSSFVGELYATSDVDLCSDSPESTEEIETYEQTREKNREFWEDQAARDPQKLQDAVVSAIIGEGLLHDSQTEVLKALSHGVSTLTVMATGRGKSLTFQVHAACEALLHGVTSLFIYPLRALIADQAFHISEALEAFGIVVKVLTGENTPEERRTIFEGLAHNEYDIILTTPEFLAYHVQEFADAAKIGFIVVDEAHHISLAKAGQRVAYATIGNTIARLGNPVVLALTATADAIVADDIRTNLGIDNCICDESVRMNLSVDDQRNLKHRDSYLANLIAGGEKTVIYVNSREKSVTLARTLRKLVPQMAPLIGFYNAGLSRLERKRIEDLFRTDSLRVLVATSAFGEGVNISNIRHVVLYHMPFNEIEFNQMSGRAGRDGEPACIHALFGRNDASINEGILRDMTPDHDCLAQVYRQLREMQRVSSSYSFTATNAEIADAASKDNRIPVSIASAACGIAVFRELGLIETHTTFSAGETMRSIHVCNTTSKVELTDSVRYREGLGEREIFQLFKDWVTKSSGNELQRRIARPILPSDQP